MNLEIFLVKQTDDRKKTMMNDAQIAEEEWKILVQPQ